MASDAPRGSGDSMGRRKCRKGTSPVLASASAAILGAKFWVAVGEFEKRWGRREARSVQIMSGEGSEEAHWGACEGQRVAYRAKSCAGASWRTDDTNGRESLAGDENRLVLARGSVAPNLN